MINITLRNYTSSVINKFIFYGKLPSKRFQRTLELIYMEYKDLIDKIRDGICPYCGRRFTRYGLKIHLRKPSNKNPCYLQHLLLIKTIQEEIRRRCGR